MTKRLTETERERMSTRIHNVFGYRKHMGNFPLETRDQAYDFWLGLIPQEVSSAIVTMKEDDLAKHMLSENWRNDFRLCIDEHTDYTISLSVRMLWYSTNGGWVVPHDNPMYEKLKEYVVNRERVDAETAKAVDWAIDLVQAANAAGQIKRVWPELIKMLGVDAANSLKNTQRASRLPNNFPYKEFMQEYDDLNRILAEGLMLKGLADTGKPPGTILPNDIKVHKVGG